MKEKQLVTLAIIGSVFGIIILFISASIAKIPEAKSISEIEEGKTAIISGNVVSVRESDSLTSVVVTTNNRIEALLFKAEKKIVKKGDYVEIRGKRKGEQFIADEVKIKN